MKTNIKTITSEYIKTVYEDLYPNYNWKTQSFSFIYDEYIKKDDTILNFMRFESTEFTTWAIVYNINTTQFELRPEEYVCDYVDDEGQLPESVHVFKM